MKKLLSLLLVMVLAFGIFVAMPTTYAEASTHGAYLGAAVEVHDARGNAVSVQEYRDVDAEKLAEAWSYAHQLLEDPQAVKVVVNIYEDWAAGKKGFGSGDGFENGALLIDDARLFLNLHGTKLTQHENKDYAIIIDGGHLKCLKSTGHHAVISGAVLVENCEIEPDKIAFNNADEVDFVTADGTSVDGHGYTWFSSAVYRNIDTGHDNKDAVMEVRIGSKSDLYYSFESGWNAAINAGTATVTLYADWLSDKDYKMGEGDGFSEGRLKVGKNKNITLDLNGHTIDRRLESSVEDGQVFRLESNGKLTIEDSKSVLSKGIITGGYSDDDGGAVYMDGSSKLVLKDVILEYNNTYDGGAGVYITGDDSELRVEGSTVIRFGECHRGGAICTDDDADVYLSGEASLVGNHASRYYNKEDEEDYGRGGAVYLDGTSALYMSGDAIIRDNSADWRGGGIFAVEDPDINIDSALDDCSIEYNYAGNYGGAISSPELRLSAWNESTYNLKGGRIVGNTVGWDGGAIHWDGDHGDLILNGVSITCNKSLNNSEYKKNGGGVHIDINADDVLIGGDVFIMYNTVNGFANNLCLYNYGNNIKTIEGYPLKDGAKISLYLESGANDDEYDDQISADSTPFNKGDSRFFIHEAEKDEAEMVIVEKDAGNGKVDLYLAHVKQAEKEYAIAEFTDFALDEKVIGSHNVSINKETKEIIVEVDADNYMLLKNVGIDSYKATGTVSYGNAEGDDAVKAARDYTQPQVFTVTAENENGFATSDWTVKAVPAGNNGWNKYTVTVEVAGETVSTAKYHIGETVAVTAPSVSGKAFVKWETADVTLENANSATTSFVMPKGAVKLKPVYMDAISEVRIEEALDVVGGQLLSSCFTLPWSDDDFVITMKSGSKTVNASHVKFGAALLKDDGGRYTESEIQTTKFVFGKEYGYKLNIEVKHASVNNDVPQYDILFADDVTVYLNGEKLDSADVKVEDGQNGNTRGYKITVNGTVKCAEAVFAGVETDKISLMLGQVSGDDEESVIYSKLPKQVKIKLLSNNKQMLMDADITWGAVEYPANSTQRLVYGTVKLPQGVKVPSGTTAAAIGNQVLATVYVAPVEPVISFGAANADGEVTVSIEVPAGSTVQYSYDGTSTQYSGPFVLTAAPGETKTVEIKAVAVSDAGNSAEVAKSHTWTHFAEIKVNAVDQNGKSIYGYKDYALTGDGRYVNGQLVAFAAKDYVEKCDGYDKQYKVKADGVTVKNGAGQPVADIDSNVSGHQFNVAGDMTIDVVYDVTNVISEVRFDLLIIEVGKSLPTELGDVNTDLVTAGDITWTTVELDANDKAVFGGNYSGKVVFTPVSGYIFSDDLVFISDFWPEQPMDNDSDSATYSINMQAGKDPLVSIDRINDIYVAHGTTEADVRSMLPATVGITTWYGSANTAPVKSWHCANEGGYTAPTDGTHVFTFIGEFDDVKGVNIDDKRFAMVNVIVTNIAAAPTADQPSGTYSGEQTVELSTTSDARIYYTLDGSIPRAGNASNNEYSSAITLPVNGDSASYVITAVAIPKNDQGVYAWDGGVSKPAVFNYTIVPQRYTVTLQSKDIELISQPVDGGFKAGDIVNIKYNNDDKHLNNWTGAGVTFSNKYVRQTSFTMPADNVSIGVVAFDKTDRVSLTVDAPIGGETFAKSASFGSNAYNGYASITWYEKDGNNEWVKVDTNATAVAGEEYKAVFRLGDNGGYKLVFHEVGEKVTINGASCADCVSSWKRVTNGAQFEHIFTATAELPKLTAQPVLAIDSVKAPTGTPVNGLYLPKTMVVETTAGDMVVNINWDDHYTTQNGKTRIDGILVIAEKINNPDNRYDLNVSLEVEFYELDANAPAAPTFRWDKANAEFVLNTNYGSGVEVYYELVALDVEEENIKSEADRYKRFATVDVPDSEVCSDAVSAPAVAGRHMVYLLTAVAAVANTDDGGNVTSYSVSQPSYFVADNRSTLTVTGGIGGGTYAAGTLVNIVANEPANANEQFICWTVEGNNVDIDAIFAEGDATSASTMLTMPAGNVTVKANYGKTLINKVVLEFAEPVGGAPISRTVTKLAVGIGDKVTEIDGSLLSQLILGWDPAPVNEGGVYYADFNTEYTGGVTLTPYPMEVTYGDNNEYRYTITAKFADDVTATINGKTATVSKQGDSISIYYTFAETGNAKLLSINDPAQIIVAAGTAVTDVIAMLPETVTAVIGADTQGSLNENIQLDVEWDTDDLSFDTAGEKVITGTVTIPGTIVKPDSVSNEVSITVNVLEGAEEGTEQVATPAASPVGGTYKDTELDAVKLSTATTGAIIYYTTDSSIPSRENGIVYTKPFAVTADTVIKAIAVQDGMLDSDVMTVEYKVLVPHTVTVTIAGVTETKSCYAGEEVTINAASGTNWVLSGIDAVTDNGNDTYTFIMPDNDVVLTVAPSGIDRVDLTMPKLEVDQPLSGYQFTCEDENVTVGVTTWDATGNVEADKHYTASVSLSADFAEHGTVYVNGNEVPSFLNKDGSVTVYYSVYTADQQLVSIGSINKTLVVANGTPLGDMQLPQSVTVKTNKVDMLEVNISWDLEAAANVYDASSKKLQNFDIHGTISLPDGIDSNGISLDVKIGVIVMGIEEDDNDRPNRPSRPNRPGKDDKPSVVDPEIVIPDITVETEPCDGGEDCVSHKFADVAADQWYHEAVDFAVHNGLMQGVAADRFDVNGTTNRAMLVTILWRLEGSPTVEHEMKFRDVPADEWYTEAIRWATANGIVSGYGGIRSGKFGAMDGLTREQFAAILYNYASYKGYDLSQAENVIIQNYADSRKISKWALPAMEWALGSGIVLGNNGYINPTDDASRAEAALLLYRFAQNNL